MAFHKVFFPEEERNAPNTGQCYKGIDNPAEDCGLPAKNPSHDVKTEYADASPVQGTDYH